MISHRLTPLIVLVVLTLVALVAAALHARRARQSLRSLAWVVLGAAPATWIALIHAGVCRPRALHFASPLWLALGVPVGLMLAIRLPALAGRMATGRRAIVSAAVAVGLFAALLATSGPELGRASDRLTVVVAVDRSRSMDLVPAAALTRATDRAVAERIMRADDRLGVVGFAAEAHTEDAPRSRGTPSPSQRVSIPPDGTDFEAAVRRALADIPPDSGGRIVLVTDGTDTRGDTDAAAALAAARGVPIDLVLLKRPPTKDVRVVALRAPQRADESEPMDLGVVVDSTSATDVEVTLSRNGEPLRTTRTRVAAGEDAIHLREIAPGPGLHRYDVHVRALDPSADTVREDNDASAFVAVRGATTALVIDGDGHTLPLAKALEAGGFVVQQRGRNQVPADIDGLAPFDLVVLGDVPASEMLPTQLSALASYTRDLGGGLLLMGGDRSLGPGGFARTPVEEVSPVAFDLRQDGRRANLSEVIIIDYSGSMGAPVGSRTKLDLANEAAARSAALLGPADRVGVMHVDTVVSWTVPLSPASNRSIERRIREVGPGGGGIYTDISLQAAYAALDREKSGLKHVLLFADGDDAEQLDGCRALVRAATAKGITTSVISLGSGNDTPELEALSKVGTGRFYLIDDAQKLPAVFAQETVLASRSAVHETPFKASVGAPSPATRAVDLTAAPALRGWVTTEAKPRASVLLGAPEGEPLLATWSIGVGRASVFTSDFKDRWGSEWIKWPGGAQLFSQLARETARKPRNPRMHVSADARGGDLRISVDAPGLGFQKLVARVRGPNGFSVDAPIEAAGRGAYVARVRAPVAGAYAIAVVDTMTSAVVETTGAVASTGRELRAPDDDARPLRTAVQTTGGVVRDTIADVFAQRPAPRFSYTPAERPFLFVAVIALLVGVAARRLSVPTWLTQLAARRPRETREPIDAAPLAFVRARKARRASPATVVATPTPVAPVLAARAATPAVTPAPTSAVRIPEISVALPVPPAAAAPARRRTAAERIAERRRAERA